MKSSWSLMQIALAIAAIILMLMAMLQMSIAWACLGGICLYQSLMNVDLAAMQFKRPQQPKKVNNTLENTEYEEIV